MNCGSVVTIININFGDLAQNFENVSDSGLGELDYIGEMGIAHIIIYYPP